MASTLLLILSLCRTLVEVAGYALLGQGILAVLAGSRRDSNGVYRLFKLVTAPVIRAMRFIMPRFVVDRHLPFVAFFILLWLWLALAWLKRLLCARYGLPCSG